MLNDTQKSVYEILAKIDPAKASRYITLCSIHGNIITNNQLKERIDLVELAKKSITR